MRIVIILCFITLLCSCTNKKSTTTTTHQQETVVPVQELNTITMEVSPDILPVGSEKVELTITNHTDTTVEFGAPYTIQRFNDATTTWEELPMDGVAFITIMYILSPGDSQTNDIYLYPDRIDYTPGRYQITKQFFIEEESKEIQTQFTLE